MCPGARDFERLRLGSASIPANFRVHERQGPSESARPNRSRQGAKRIETRKDPMNVKTKWLSVLAAAAALGAIACGPPPTDKAIEETPEGSPCPQSALIDDGEDNNNQVMVQDGRSGYWYTYVDHEGSTIEPAAGETGGIFSFTQGGVNGSQYAARMSGTVGKASIVYAGMGCNLTDPKGAFDGSKYGGVSFWAKRGPNATPKVRYKMPDGATDPDGQICSACYNDFGM